MLRARAIPHAHTTSLSFHTQHYIARHQPPVGLAQEEVEKPKTLREHIEAELASTNTALAEAKASKSYQSAADAKNQLDALTVALKHVDFLTSALVQAESKHDFETCAKVRRARNGLWWRCSERPPAFVRARCRIRSGE